MSILCKLGFHSYKPAAYQHRQIDPPRSIEVGDMRYTLTAIRIPTRKECERCLKVKPTWRGPMELPGENEMWWDRERIKDTEK